MLCQQGGCLNGYRHYDVHTSGACGRRPVVDVLIDKNITTMTSQVYLSSKFAEQPGIYLFSLHQQVFWLSLKHSNHQEMMESYAKRSDNSRVRSNIEIAKEVLSKNLPLRKPLNYTDALHKLHDSASKKQLQQWRQEDIEEADFALYKWYFFSGLNILVLLLIGVILLFTTRRVIKPKFNTPTKEYVAQRLRPLAIQVLIILASGIYSAYVIWDMWLGMLYVPFMLILLLAELSVMLVQVVITRDKRSNH